MSMIFYVPMSHFDNLNIFHFTLVIENSVEMEKSAVDANRELWTQTGAVSNDFWSRKVQGSID